MISYCKRYNFTEWITMSELFEIAKEAGVSIATVSRVLNKKPHVKDEIREKILAIISKKHYKPKFTARRNKIAIIVDAKDKILLGNYQTILISTISKRLIEEEIDFEMLPASELGYAKESFLMAAIAIISFPPNMEKIKATANIPIITINSPQENCPGVFSEHCEGVKSALKYLFGKGHRKIGMLGPDLLSWGSKERHRGYMEGIKELGLNNTESLFQITENQNYFEAVGKILKANPTAIIVSGEDMIMQTNYALHLFNKKIPDDISLIVYENNNICPYHIPP